ncbi:MAG TPA: helix-turn-helix transcriptional regulator [Gemmataceae bacterium]
MATRELERGPVGKRVGENLRALRDARRLSVYDLARRLSTIGRSILPSGISKTESGARRVDVDDLVAFAVALDTTPNRLLLGPDVRGDLAVTERLTVPAEAAWRWAAGDEPFPLDLWGQPGVLDLDRLGRVRQEGRPHQPPEPTVKELFEAPAAQREALDSAARAILDAVGQGLRLDAIVSYAKLQLTMADLARTVAKRRGISPEELASLIEQEEQEGQGG